MDTFAEAPSCYPRRNGKRWRPDFGFNEALSHLWYRASIPAVL